MFVTNELMSHSIPLHILIHGRVPSDYHWTDWNYHARKFIFGYKYVSFHCPGLVGRHRYTL
ncbi:hypothetical protein T06_1639 [Trichinella sp. T6]|nr:hypothetical protein T06_1639 [Trichinella sp. T6]